MKIVIAIDSLKGSIDSITAGNAIKEGILRVDPNAKIVVKPLADGGEGTADALIGGLSGKKIDVVVKDPLGRDIQAYYGYLPASNTAVMEMAAAAGIMLVTEAEKDPLQASTFGVGMMIKDAINKGIRNFIIGIGGSATNDGGVGMLQALGFSFFDAEGNSIPLGGKGLSKIVRVDIQQAIKELSECSFKIACDVTNPLYGTNGATYIYGPQKGADKALCEVLDEGMKQYAKVTAETLGTKYDTYPGSGAAGGLGFAFISYLQGALVPGIDLVLEVTKLEEELVDADYVITGEGRLDHQTAMGKAPIGVAKLAKKCHKKVIAFAGSVTPDARACNEAGIDAFFPIVREITTLQEAMKPEVARENLMATVEQVFRLLVKE